MNKRNFSKAMAIAIATSMIAGNVSYPVNAENVSGGRRLAKAVQQQKEKQQELYEKAMISISDEEKQALVDKEKLDKTVAKKDKQGNIQYAEYYAGAYINEEDNLVVQFTEDVTKEKVNEVAEQMSAETEIEKVDTSYEDLLLENEKINNKLEALAQAVLDGTATVEEKAVYENLNGVMLSQSENTNIVSMKQVNEETKGLFGKYFDAESVTFEEVKKSEVEEQFTVNPGESFGIYTHTDAKGQKWYDIGRSVGPRVYYERSDGSILYGFLTAAHCVKEGNGQEIYFNVGGTFIKYGKVVKWKYGGCADVAFVKQTNEEDFETSRYAAYSNKSGNTTYKYKACQSCWCATIGVDLVEGATVYKCGQMTYLTSGKIKSLSVSTKDTSDGTVFRNMITATYNATSGDSGGVVFTVHNSNTYTYDVAGVHRGTMTDTGYAVFTSLERYDMCNEDPGFYQY